MTTKTFFSIQELKIKDSNAPNLKVSQEEFDFVVMASSYGDGVKYIKHEIYSKAGDKWYMIVTFERTIKEIKLLQSLPFTKQKI